MGLKNELTYLKFCFYLKHSPFFCAMQRLENIKEEVIKLAEKSQNTTLKNKVLDFFSEYEANKDTKYVNDFDFLKAKYVDFSEANKPVKYDDIWYLNISMFSSELLNNLFLFNNLKALYISGMSIKDVKGIESLKSLQFLFLNDCKIRSFDNLTNLEKLIFLDLQNNSIRKIPDSILNLKNLSYLDLSRNLITKIPNHFSNMSNLCSLNLNHNNIKKIDTIFQLHNLIKLSLHNNKLSNNFDGISNLNNLEYLQLTYNDFTYIDKNIYELKNLRYLDLSYNPIANIDSSIIKLSNLKILHLVRCNLRNIPKEIGNIDKLESLSLEENELEIIPDSICNLINLKYLYLWGNNLRKLPENIGNLVNLQQLDLADNKLIEYPKSLAKLRKLHSLGESKHNILFSKVYPNPLDNMPEEVKNFSLIELFDYLEGDKEVYTYYTFWDIPKELKADFQAYLASFPQYVEMIAGKDISESFKTEQVKGGLKLTAITSKEVHIEDFDNHLANYVTIFLEQSAEQMKADKENNADYIQVFKLQQYLHKLRQVNRNLTDSIETYKRESELYTQILKDKDKQVQELNIQIRFFQDNYSKILDIAKSTLDFDKIKLVVETVIEEKQRPLLPAPPTNGNGFDAGKLLRDLIDKAIRLTERKKTHKIEDLHNNDFAHYLRDRHYYVTDQTQSGIGITGKNLGEIDIMLRNRHSGTPISIIEAFRLDSCGEKDTIVSTHLDKLLHNYDTAGLKTNFVIVYAEAKNFGQLWENYVKYMQNLNTKPEFRGKYPLITFTDTSAGNSVALSVRVGLALHQREGGTVEVYHIFIDMA
ncbi:MAG: leucine-rich repeat domain-containing protein [Bacteroidetes bacterium]|nr:MAG: leucine-rich repeat domain-containing protein [Bacteroidota bacterium]